MARLIEMLSAALPTIRKIIRGYVFFGHFRDLDEHGDDQLYSKEEPPSSISGRETEGKLDFIVVHSPGVRGGVEVLEPTRNRY